MNRHKLVGVALIIAVFAVASLAVLTSMEGPESGTVATKAASSTESAAGSAALRAYLDPETGEIAVGPSTASELELDPETENAIRRDDQGLVQVRHADGSVSMDLQGRYQSVAIARRNADGTVTVCTDDAARAEQAINGVVTPSSPEVK